MKGIYGCKFHCTILSYIILNYFSAVLYLHLKCSGGRCENNLNLMQTNSYFVKHFTVKSMI